ncbi:MAG: hypothetical protein RXQ71_02540 [Caldisphaera sp.]
MVEIKVLGEGLRIARYLLKIRNKETSLFEFRKVMIDAADLLLALKGKGFGCKTTYLL